MTGESRLSSLRSWLGWGLFAAAAAVAVIDLDARPSNPLVHPEALYPAALYMDLDHWKSWNTPFSPYFFPDLPLFFAAMGLTGDAIGSLYLFAALQVALLIVGLRWLFGRILLADQGLRRYSERLTVLAGAGLMLTLGLDLSAGKLMLPLFLTAFHTGAWVTAVFGHAILITLLDEAPQAAARRPTIGLLVLSFLGALSDPLFYVLFVVPAAAAILFRALTGEPGCRRRPLMIAAAIVLGALLAAAAVAAINATGTLHVPSLTPAGPSRVAETLSALPGRVDGVLAFVVDRFFERARAPFRGFWFLWLALTLTLVFATRRRLARLPGFRNLERLEAASRRRLALFAVFTAVSCVASVAATVYVAVGQYAVQTDVYGILFVHRYLTSVFVLPVFCVALYVPVLLARRGLPAVETVALALLMALCSWRIAKTDLGPSFPSYRHPAVACLDDAAAQRGARRGLAFSFDVPLINVLSRSGLHADQTTSDFVPTTWIDNRVRAGGAGYDFVITGSLRPGTVVERAGPPASTVVCDGWQVFFYEPAIRIAG